MSRSINESFEYHKVAVTKAKLSMQGPHSLKLLIVAEEPSVRSEFTELCRRVTDLHVLGEAESGRAALDAAKSLSPDVMHHYLVGENAEAQITRLVLRLLARRPKLLVGERHHRLYPLDIEKIDYIEADGNYVTIRAGDAEYISRDSIKRLSTELADFGFVRIDRSILLNIRAVQFAEPVGHGILAFTLTSGACLHSSKTYRETISRILPWHHCRTGSDSA
ncbi:MAG: response regulator transcription factor [Steroidobacteraceae bacterium]